MLNAQQVQIAINDYFLSFSKYNHRSIISINVENINRILANVLLSEKHLSIFLSQLEKQKFSTLYTHLQFSKSWCSSLRGPPTFS